MKTKTWFDEGQDRMFAEAQVLYTRHPRMRAVSAEVRGVLLDLSNMNFGVAKGVLREIADELDSILNIKSEVERALLVIQDGRRVR